MEGDNHTRIQTLDSFRFISITLVVLFHFVSRWTYPMLDDNYYPFGNRFAHLPLIEYGGIGVHLFFIISGFVILFTLERTRSVGDFFIRRLIRLWPTMLLCSILTFLTVRLLDPGFRFRDFEVGFKNFLPGLTFTPTEIWNTRYMDSAYWSLEVEVKFYILSGLSYFLFKSSFAKVWTAGTVLILLGYFFTPLRDSYLFNYLSFPTYLPFFSAGILFYTLFSGKRGGYEIPAILIFLAMGLQTREPIVDKVCMVAFFALFFVFVYRGEWLDWLNRPAVLSIGVASYPLYLFHQHAGVIVMDKMAKMLPLQGNWQIIYPLTVFAGMCAVSVLIYRYYELPVKRMLMRMVRPARQSAAITPAEPILKAVSIQENIKS